MADEQMKIDAVFEGGGVKGIGLVGAVAVTENRGYRFENVAGTSAGAIIAALIASGYKAEKLKEEFAALDFRRFKDKDFLDKVPLIGYALSLGFEKGIYEGKVFENWVRGLLENAPNGPVRTFGDLKTPLEDDAKYRYKLKVIAADISRNKMLVLPDDIKDYGILPDDLDVTLAVRMSMSIPYFFEPVVLKDTDGNECYIVDGGVLSNYPVWIFDDGTQDPPWPTIGYRLVEPDSERPNRINGPISLFAALFSTMMDAHDARYIESKNFARTIPIPTCGVRTTDFCLTDDKKEELYDSGCKGAETFFQNWDFGQWVGRYRKSPVLKRKEEVWTETSKPADIPGALRG